jgi:hypothetical protein
VPRRVQIVQESFGIIRKSTNTKTQLSRCKLMLEMLNDLLPYSDMGIPMFQVPVRSLISSVEEMRIAIVKEGTEKQAEAHLLKAESAATKATKVTAATRALQEVQAAKAELGDDEELLELEIRVKEFLHSTNLNAFLDTARKHEFKGNKKKALSEYQEALYFLLTDEIDDAQQQEIIAEVKGKIEQLSKELGTEVTKNPA